jgi:hypothetical protein
LRVSQNDKTEAGPFDWGDPVEFQRIGAFSARIMTTSSVINRGVRQTCGHDWAAYRGSRK